MKRHTLALALIACLAPFAAPMGAAQAAEPTKAELTREAEALMATAYRTDAPGAAVLIARGDTVLFRAARGEADVEAHTPLKPDSVFRLGSVTKQFAAAGLLKLVEAGKVKLDDPLSKYVPDYPGADAITVRMILNHTSGVFNYTNIPGYMGGAAIRADLTTAQLIDAFKGTTPDFAPGAKWNYSNSGYVLVGAVIEAASGKPWHVYLDEVLFKPLGMKHTGYGHDPKFAAMQVHGYTYAKDKVVPMMTLSMTQPHAAGALVSNVDDLLKWNRALHEGRVLKSETYTQMITPTGAAAQNGNSYGFGIMAGTVRGAPVLRHNGGIFGFTTALSYFPGPDITVVVLENDDSDNGSDDADTLARKLSAVALGNPYPAMKAVAVDAATLQAAQGVYRFDGGVIRTLRMVDGKLTAQRDQAGRTELTPIGTDDFLYADGFNRLKLQRGPAEAISGMRFFPNGEGDGIVGVRSADPLPPLPVAMQLPRAALDRLVGVYEGSGLTLTVFLDADAPKAQLAGQPPVTLRAKSPTTFDIVEAPAELEFTPGDTPAADVTLRQGGNVLVLKRKP